MAVLYPMHVDTSICCNFSKTTYHPCAENPGQVNKVASRDNKVGYGGNKVASRDNKVGYRDDKVASREIMW